MVRELDSKGCEFESRADRNWRWREWMHSALSTFNTMTEMPLSKAPNPQLLPGRCSINGCPLLRVCVHGVCVFTAVCAHFGWVKCRAQIPRMGHHTWLYVMSLSLSNKPTTKIIDWSFLCQWANIQNQQGIKYPQPPPPPHTHTHCILYNKISKWHSF